MSIRARTSAAIATLVLLIGLLVVYSATSLPQRADAAGCGAEIFTNSTTGWVDGDNLKVAGRPLKWTFSLSHRECDGYDLVTDVGANLSKSNTGCEAFGGKTDGYKFNPNSLGAGAGAFNGAEQWVNCIVTAGNYGVSFPGYDGTRIGQYMDGSERCLNFTFTVDVIAQADPSYDNADPICLDGQ